MEHLIRSRKAEPHDIPRHGALPLPPRGGPPDRPPGDPRHHVWTLEIDVLGILRLALDQGTDTLTEKQTWRLLYGAWVPNVAVECSRDGGPLQPWEMVQATAQGGRCSFCENAWQKILAE